MLRTWLTAPGVSHSVNVNFFYLKQSRGCTSDSRLEGFPGYHDLTGWTGRKRFCPEDFLPGGASISSFRDSKVLTGSGNCVVFHFIPHTVGLKGQRKVAETTKSRLSPMFSSLVCRCLSLCCNLMQNSFLGAAALGQHVTLSH